MPKTNLKLDWCSYKAAKYACDNWHYSKCIPVGKLVKIGVWEDGIFIGCLIFGRGANNGLLTPYSLKQNDGCELVRIALKKHKSAVSRMIKLAIMFLKKSNKGLRLIISFADSSQGHHGGVYQATNWIYTGESDSAEEYLYKGKRWHGRAFRNVYGSHKNYIDKGLVIVQGSRKHRDLMPLDNEIRSKIECLGKTYPKRVTKANSSDQLESGGALPTDTLQLSDNHG